MGGGQGRAGQLFDVPASHWKHAGNPRRFCFFPTKPIVINSIQRLPQFLSSPLIYPSFVIESCCGDCKASLYLPCGGLRPEHSAE